MMGSKGETLLKVETTSTEKNLAILFLERPPEGYSFNSLDEAFEYAEQYMRESKEVKEYYVCTMFPYDLRDIVKARVKTPAKYFTSYKKARIFQLQLAFKNDIEQKKQDDEGYLTADGKYKLLSEGDMGEYYEYHKTEPEYFV